MATHPNQVAEACQQFAKETGYNLTASPGPANLSITSVGKAAHGSTPYKGVNAAMQLFAFLATLDLASSDMSEAIRFVDSQIDMETDGRSLGLAMEDEPSGNLTLNVGLVNVTLKRMTLGLNIRYPVTFAFDEVMSRLNQSLVESGFIAEVSQQVQDPLYYPKDSPLIVTLTRVYAQHTGRNDSAIALEGEPTPRRCPISWPTDP